MLNTENVPDPLLQSSHPPYPLETPYLALSIEDEFLGGLELEGLYQKLPREDPERIASIYDQIAAHYSFVEQSVRPSDIVTKQWQPNPSRYGLQMAEAANRLDVSQATLSALLEHHMILELVPYGGRQNRRLLSEEAERAGLGHNVCPWGRVPCIEGMRRSAPFPVIYEDRLKDILWVTDWETIQLKVWQFTSRKQRLEWLVENHRYLPVAEIAALSGYSERTTKRRLKETARAA